MSQPTEQHTRLQAFVGTWNGEDTLFPSPWDPHGGTATTTYSGRLAMNDFFVVGDDVQEREGYDVYRAHKVFGWDAAEQTYTLYFFDSTGQNPAAPARGAWEGNRVTFQQATPTGYVRYSYTFTQDDEYTFQMSTSEDGEQWTPFIEGIYRRMQSW
jgi:hypothetical protein